MWEYNILNFQRNKSEILNDDLFYSRLKNKLNEFGENKWELVSMDIKTSDNIICVFKRQKITK